MGRWAVQQQGWRSRGSGDAVSAAFPYGSSPTAVIPLRDGPIQHWSPGILQVRPVCVPSLLAQLLIFWWVQLFGGSCYRASLHLIQRRKG